MGLVKKTVNITDQQEAWVKARIADGKYGNDSELIRDLIRKEQDREEGMSRLRAAIQEGRDSGLSDLTFDQIVQSALKQRRERGEL